MNIREEVERRLPNWRSWYPSLFEAAADLGIIRARVCDPNTLFLQSRHAAVRGAAEHAHRDQWGGNEHEVEPPVQLRVPGGKRRRRRKPKRG